MGAVRVLVVAPLLVVLVLMASGCDDGPRVDGARADRPERSGPTQRPDEYADYLLARETQRRNVSDLVGGLEVGTGGTVDVLDAQYETCGFDGDTTYAFGHSVTSVLRGARVEPGLPSVVAVLEAHGWTVTEDPHLYQGVQYVLAERDGVRVTVNEGDPTSRLVVRAGGGCFDVPEEDRRELRDLDRDELEKP